MSSVIGMGFRFALRVLAKNPGFTAFVVLTLGLGIGATCSVFSVVSTVLLRPLPYAEPDRLVQVWQTIPLPETRQVPTSAGNFADWQRLNKVFSGMGGFTQSPFILTGAGEPERLAGAAVTPELFPLLGVQPAIGRLFSA